MIENKFLESVPTIFSHAHYPIIILLYMSSMHKHFFRAR